MIYLPGGGGAGRAGGGDAGIGGTGFVNWRRGPAVADVAGSRGVWRGCHGC